MSILDLFHINITTEFRSLLYAAWKKEEVEAQMLSSFFLGVEWMQLSPFPVIVLDFSDTRGMARNTDCILNSCLQLNDILSVDKPKDTVRMGWGWGNALRRWIKWHILWNVAKHPISFKDEAEEAQGIIQPETVLVKVRNGMKWRLKKWKLKD